MALERSADRRNIGQQILLNKFNPQKGKDQPKLQTGTPEFQAAREKALATAKILAHRAEVARQMAQRDRINTEVEHFNWWDE